MAARNNKGETMSNGEEHAKQTVRIQMDTIKRKLGNGHQADPETHGAALLLILQIVEPLFSARFVTEDQLQTALPRTNQKWNLSWKGVAAVWGSVAMLCGTAIKIFM
jgi:hypothetical protein